MNLDTNTSLALMNAAQSKNTAVIKNTQQATQTAAQKAEEAKLNAVAEDFEAMFMSQMMQPMFEGIKPNAMFGGGKTEEVFTGMMIQEYGKMMAETGQLGIADQVKRSLIELQAQANSGGRHVIMPAEGSSEGIKIQGQEN